MRTTDGATLALLTGPVRRYAHRVELENADGDWIDVTRMWLSFTWNESQDAGAASGTLRLRRETVRGDEASVLASDDMSGGSPEDNWGASTVIAGPFGNYHDFTLNVFFSWNADLDIGPYPDVLKPRTFTGLPADSDVWVTAEWATLHSLGDGGHSRADPTCRTKDATTGAVQATYTAAWTDSTNPAPGGWIPAAVAGHTDALGRLTIELGFTSIIVDTSTNQRSILWDNVTIWNARPTRHSLAPLVVESDYNQIDGEYAPLANPFRGVRVASAVYAPGDEPSHDDAEAWETWYAGLVFTDVFRGVIDDPSWGGRSSVIELPVRDLAAPLQDALIDDEHTYGSVAGTPIEDVQQQILVDNGFIERGDGSLTIEVLGDTEDWSLQRFAQAIGVNVWDAVRTLALQMGWDFRYWFHADDTYRPTLRKPRRDTLTVDLSLSAAQFVDVPRVSLLGTDVRNDGRLTYRDAGTGQLATVYQRNLGSITEFGSRKFGIVEDATSNIDTEAEAQQMLDAAVADLATPYVEQDTVLSYCWPIQLGDVLAFPATTVFYDDALRFGVVGVRHEIGPESAACKTTVSLRGKPIGAYQRWLDLLGTRAIADQTPRPVIGPLLGDGAPDGGTTDDAACWLPVTYEKNTDGLDVFVEAGLTSPVALPLLDDASRAYSTRRHEGKAPQAAAARTVLFLAMWPDYYMKTYSRPFGHVGSAQVLGTPIAHEAQAVNGFEATLGAITSFAVERSTDGTGNTLTWTAAACSSPYAVEFLIWRNGEVIDRIPWTSAGTYEDTDLPVDREFQYDIQAWTNDGVAFARSGAPARGRHDPAAPAADRVPTVYANLVTTGAGFPGIGVSIVPGAGVTDVLVVELAVDSGDVTGTFGFLREYPYDGATVPAFTDVAVVAGRTYRYRAYARTAGMADSDYSAEASVTIPLTAGVPSLDGEVSAEGETPAITLLVTPPTGAETITVYRARSSLSFAVLVSGVAVDTGASQTAYVDDAIIGGKQYRYYVTTTESGVESAPSNTVTFIAPMPP